MLDISKEINKSEFLRHNEPLNNKQYRAWSDSDCMDVQAGLALYWWQGIINSCAIPTG
jgi:hypothetical protein